MLNSSFLLAVGDWSPILMIALLFVLLYFIMIRPQKKQQQRDEEMRGALQVGDEVTTIGGIIGKVISIKGETFVLESTKDKTKIRFLKGAIRNVDVKAADIAAQVMEANQASDEELAADADADADFLAEAATELEATEVIEEANADSAKEKKSKSKNKNKNKNKNNDKYKDKQKHK